MQPYLAYMTLYSMLILFGYCAFHTTVALWRHEQKEKKDKKLKLYRLAEKLGLQRLENSNRTGVIHSK